MFKNILYSNIFLLRIITSFVLAIVSLTAIIYSGLFLIFVISILVILMSFEWIKITEKNLNNNLFVLKIFSNLFCFYLSFYNLYLGLFLVLLSSIFYTLFFQSNIKSRFYVFVGPIYLCVPIILLYKIRLEHTYGIEILLWCVLITWTTDIFSYIGGKAIGGYKLCKSISPNKTWSGLIVGIFSSLMLTIIILRYFDLYTNSIMLWSLLLSISVQLGDLFESLIKRKHDIKDSGKILPGHGGVLDRVDGLLFCAFFISLGAFFL